MAKCKAFTSMGEMGRILPLFCVRVCVEFVCVCLVFVREIESMSKKREGVKLCLCQCVPVFRQDVLLS